MGHSSPNPLFYDFVQDAAAWEIEDQYMFGPNLIPCRKLEDKLFGAISRSQ
ncbi:hypothetical protein [Paenibacillus stellifer]|uniref:hypothetical protein n=1 Tax=Paenibacillus stellifer TaxID=169760 RepID=UPI003CCC0B5B